MCYVCLWWGNTGGCNGSNWLTITITIAIACIDHYYCHYHCLHWHTGCNPITWLPYPSHNHHYVVCRGRHAWHCKSHYHYYRALIAGCRCLILQYLLPIPSNLRHYPVECPPPTFQSIMRFSCMLLCLWKLPIHANTKSDAEFHHAHATTTFVWHAMLLDEFA